MHVASVFGALEIPDGGSLRVTVTERLVSDNMVLQRERIRAHVNDRLLNQLTWVVIYMVRGDRIHELWYPGPEFDPRDVAMVEDPTFDPGTGPTVWFDVAHGNTATPGSMRTFTELLLRDGYSVRPWHTRFDTTALDSIDVLMIVNPAPVGGASGPAEPEPRAFTPAEVESLVRWVDRGGRLLLAVDHAPYPGYSADLAAELGVTFHDGFVRDTSLVQTGNILFRSGAGLRSHAITEGRRPTERVEAVATLLGQGFEATAEVEPLMVLPESAVLIPDGAEMDAAVPAAGWLQGGVREFGDGRVALFGEVFMLRYINGANPQLEGAENGQFILNLMRWLSEGLGP